MEPFEPLYPPIEKIDYLNYIMSQVNHLSIYKSILQLSIASNSESIQFIVYNSIKEIEELLNEKLSEIGTTQKWEIAMRTAITNVLTR